VRCDECRWFNFDRATEFGPTEPDLRQAPCCLEPAKQWRYTSDPGCRHWESRRNAEGMSDALIERLGSDERKGGANAMQEFTDATQTPAPPGQTKPPG